MYQQLEPWVYLDVDHPLVAWTTYVGRLESVDHRAAPDFTPVALRHAALLRECLVDHAPKRLVAEVRLEAIRQASFPAAVSRLTGLYFFEDRATAQRAREHWGPPHFKPSWLAQIGFAASRVTRVDSEWITACFEDPDPGWMHRYWRGEAHGSQPIWELILDGAGFVWGTELRREAWEVLGVRFPSSALLLDVCRIAQEVGDFNFGRVVPYIHATRGKRYRLDYILDFRDADNHELLGRLAKYDGPRNAVVAVDDEPQLVLPDLRPEGFEFSVADGTTYPAVSTVIPGHGMPPSDLIGRGTRPHQGIDKGVPRRRGTLVAWNCCYPSL